jgi:hypothetical protein
MYEIISLGAYVFVMTSIGVFFLTLARAVKKWGKSCS